MPEMCPGGQRDGESLALAPGDGEPWGWGGAEGRKASLWPGLSSPADQVPLSEPSHSLESRLWQLSCRLQGAPWQSPQEALPSLFNPFGWHQGTAAQSHWLLTASQVPIQSPPAPWALPAPCSALSWPALAHLLLEGFSDPSALREL